MTERCEGCYLYTYDDKGPWEDGAPIPFEEEDELIGTLTIGHGHTGDDVVPGLRITQEQADALFLEDIKEAEDGVKSCVTVPLKQSEFDACCDQVFNTGIGAFSKPSTILRRLNAGDYDRAGEAILMWYKTKGMEYGMLKRCAARYALFMGLPWDAAYNSVTRAMTGSMLGNILTLKEAAAHFRTVAERQRDSETKAFQAALKSQKKKESAPVKESAPKKVAATSEGPTTEVENSVSEEVKEVKPLKDKTVTTEAQKPSTEYKNYNPNAPPKSPLQSKQVHGDFLKVMAWLGAAPGIMLAMPDWLGPLKTLLVAVASMSPVQMDAMASIGMLVVGQGLSYYGKITAKRPIR